VGLLSGGLGNPTAGFNVYGYFGFALTLAILPVYALANLAVINYFRKRPDFSLIKHLLLPLLGSALMIALLVGQIIENQVAPYDWMPWAIVGWLAVVIIGAFWLGRTRPEALVRAGSIMATAELLEERALHSVGGELAGDPD
jgi:amino acid transporter